MTTARIAGPAIVAIFLMFAGAWRPAVATPIDKTLPGAQTTAEAQIEQVKPTYKEVNSVRR